MLSSKNLKAHNINNHNNKKRSNNNILAISILDDVIPIAIVTMIST